MSSRQPLKSRDSDDIDGAVARYLSHNPGFFTRHPELVGELEIPHVVHGAVSLVEHRVYSLRREVQDLKAQMSRFVDNARRNEELARRLHRLMLQLLEADSLDELLATLYQAMEQGFGAEFTSFRLFGEPRSPENRGLAEFVGSASELRGPFEPLLEDMEPRCGPVRPPQLTLLFAERAPQVASAALIPINAAPLQGVLAIGSRDPHRHLPGHGTHYLRQLADVVGRLVARAL